MNTPEIVVQTNNFIQSVFLFLLFKLIALKTNEEKKRVKLDFTFKWIHSWIKYSRKNIRNVELNRLNLRLNRLQSIEDCWMWEVLYGKSSLLKTSEFLLSFWVSIENCLDTWCVHWRNCSCDLIYSFCLNHWSSKLQKNPCFYRFTLYDHLNIYAATKCIRCYQLRSHAMTHCPKSINKF